MLGRLSAGEGPPDPPKTDLSGLEGKALERAQADRAYRAGLAAWRTGVLDGLWSWEALVLRASSSAADVAVLERAPLVTVALAVLRSSLSDS